MLPTKFRVNGLSVQEKKRKTDFQDDRHLGFLIKMILAISDLHPVASYQFSSQLALWIRKRSKKKKKKKEFQDGHHDSYFGFLIGKILSVFDQHVTPMLPTKFRVNWPSVQEQKRKRDFASGLLDFRSEQFKLFLIYKSPQCFLPSFQSTGCLVQEKRKIDF